MLPFSVDQFLAVFEAYNTAIWPAQIVAYLLGLAALALAVRPVPAAGRIICAILALFWLWMGVLYHIAHFATINPAAYAFGALFVVEAALLLYAGVVRRDLSFRMTGSGYAVLGLAMIVYAGAIYGLLAPLFGHLYPRVPLFGVAPCPTTIFTLGLFLLTTERLPKYLLVIPVLWSLIGGSAALLLGVPEDYGLIVSGLLAAAAIVARDRRTGQQSTRPITLTK